MKKIMKFIITVSATLFISLSLNNPVEACGCAGSFKELDKLGIELEYYTVNKVEKNKYTAVSPNGKQIIFNDSDTPDKIKKWNRVRVFIEDGDITTVEVVKPTLIEYKVTKIEKSKNRYRYHATSKKNGGVIFGTENLEGKQPKIGDIVIVEYDMLYIEGGLIKAYKK